MKKHQKKMDESTFPTNDEKLNIFLNARKLFLENDYQAIAMDHFSLKEDILTSENLSEIFDTNVHINVKNNRYFVEEIF